MGISTIFLLDGYFNLVFHPDIVRLHSGVPLTSIAIAELLDIAFLGALFAAGFWVLRRFPFWPFLEMLTAALLFPLLPWHKMLGVDDWSGPLPILLVACFTASILVALRYFSRRVYALVMKGGGNLLGAFGVFAFVVFGQLFRLMPWRPSSYETAPLSASPARNANSPLLVWIVFDELSYQQTFGHPASHLALPQLNALRAESTLYQQAIPSSNDTELAIPSMLLGKPVYRTTDTTSNQVRYKTSGNANWEDFDAKQTIFGNARQAKLRTGLVGWYNPYCQMLAGTLDSCWCSKAAAFSYPLSTQGVWPNAVSILRDLIDRAFRPSHALNERNDGLVQEQLTTYKEVYARSISVLESPGYDFIFIHIPTPRPPGIYDRRTAQFVATFGKSYLDNLALVDRTLGDFLSILNQSPRWNRTSIVVDGNHTWRVNHWREMKLLTEEDKQISQGQEDQRPALLVHHAGQVSPDTVKDPFPLAGVHDIVIDLLSSVTP